MARLIQRLTVAVAPEGSVGSGIRSAPARYRDEAADAGNETTPEQSRSRGAQTGGNQSSRNSWGQSCSVDGGMTTTGHGAWCRH